MNHQKDKPKTTGQTAPGADKDEANKGTDKQKDNTARPAGKQMEVGSKRVKGA